MFFFITDFVFIYLFFSLFILDLSKCACVDCLIFAVLLNFFWSSFDSVVMGCVRFFFFFCWTNQQWGTQQQQPFFLLIDVFTRLVLFKWGAYLKTSPSLTGRSPFCHTYMYVGMYVPLKFLLVFLTIVWREQKKRHQQK